MTLSREAAKMLPAVEAELQRQIARLDAPRTRAFHDMLRYHMGWNGAGAGPEATGKRIRPLLCLLTCSSVGGRWRAALPAAAALEIVHNFSLVHDDIQDNSPTRRGRPALWKKFGSPIAINAGDALLTIANEAILDLRRAFSNDAVIAAGAIVQATCLDLTRGQFLDLEHQAAGHLSLRGYWVMVEGKTAALLSACTRIGALLGGAARSVGERYGEFGRLLGLAFQVQDDMLGIWGNEALTGKSAASDLAEGKLSLPVLYGIRKSARFARLRRAAPRTTANIAKLRQVLTDVGAHSYAANQGKRLTRQAQRALSSLKPRGTAGAALVELTNGLLGREK